MAQDSNAAAGTPAASAAVATKPPVKVVPKNGVNPNFGMNMPKMVSAFDTAAWLRAAA